MPTSTICRSCCFSSNGTLYEVSIHAFDSVFSLAMKSLLPKLGPKLGFLSIALLPSFTKHLNGGKGLLGFREKMKALRVSHLRFPPKVKQEKIC